MDARHLTRPETLSPARVMAHSAVQLLYRAAVANLDKRPGDDHSNLGWDAALGGFKTHPLGPKGVQVGLSLAPLCLHVAGQSRPLAGQSPTEALHWLDSLLEQHGLAAAGHVTVTYDLPTEVDAVGRFSDVDGATGLAAWFDLADRALGALAGTLQDLSPGASPVRCWPHHFDIATYVGLEPGGAEEARGIGVGLSPGDESYDQPYFYVNPWPHPDAVALPEAVAPGHWHVAGFVGSVATSAEILTESDIDQGVARFLGQSFAVCRHLLDA